MRGFSYFQQSFGGNIMHHATLCYMFDYTNPEDIKVLLGMKKEGFGKGHLNGLGGKVKSIDRFFGLFTGNPYDIAARRETKEEGKIKVYDLEKVAEIEFRFTNAPLGKDWDQIVHVYFTKKWKGTPQETEEMKSDWYSVSKVLKKKFLKDNFWETDTYWFPEVLGGKKIYGYFLFDKDNKSVKEYKLTETTSFKR